MKLADKQKAIHLMKSGWRKQWQKEMHPVVLFTIAHYAGFTVKPESNFEERYVF
jgi:hypothetical protein